MKINEKNNLIFKRFFILFYSKVVEKITFLAFEVEDLF